MARRRKPRSIQVLAVVAAAAAAAALLTLRPGRPAVEIEDRNATAWFPSTATGSAVLIDGATGRVVTRVPDVADRRKPFTVRQLGVSALVVGGGNDRVRRVDGGSWELTASSPTGVASSELLVGKRDAWLRGARDVPGYLRRLNAGAPRLIGPVTSTRQPIIGGAVSDDGTAWLVDADGGVSLARPGKEAHDLPHPAGPDATIHIVGDHPVVVATDGRARVLDPATGAIERVVDLETEPVPEIVNASSDDRSWILAVDDGQLVVNELDGKHRRFDIDLGPGAGGCGMPVEHDGLVYVPQPDTGSVVVADPVEERVVTTVDLNHEPDAHFAGSLVMFVHEDKVWFDDPTGDSAGVFVDPTTPVVVSKAHDPPTDPPMSTTSVPTTSPDTSASTTSTPTVATERPEDPFPTATTAGTVPDPGPTTATSPTGSTTPRPTSTTATSSTTTTSTPGPPPCGRDPATITVDPTTEYVFNVTVEICVPPPQGSHDWVMVELQPARPGEQPQWFAKALIGPSPGHCTVISDGHYSCPIVLRHDTVVGRPRAFVVVRFPAQYETWPEDLYNADSSCAPIPFKSSLPAPDLEISERKISVLQPTSPPQPCAG